MSRWRTTSNLDLRCLQRLSIVRSATYMTQRVCGVVEGATTTAPPLTRWRRMLPRLLGELSLVLSQPDRHQRVRRLPTQQTMSGITPQSCHGVSGSLLLFCVRGSINSNWPMCNGDIDELPLQRVC